MVIAAFDEICMTCPAAKLFGTQRPAVIKHLGNIFKIGELDKKFSMFHFGTGCCQRKSKLNETPFRSKPGLPATGDKIHHRHI